MKLRHLASIASAGLLAAFGATSASAIPLQYSITGGSITSLSADPGLVVNTSLSAGLAGTTFTLDDGESSGWFDFFRIWTNEGSVNADDLVESPISATLTFSDPGTDATVDGMTFGRSVLFGLGQYGGVHWQDPAPLVLGDRTFKISLSNQYYNVGILGLASGQRHAAVVRASITQVNSVASVPDAGNTLVLLGAGLVAFGLFRRRALFGASRGAA